MQLLCLVAEEEQLWVALSDRSKEEVQVMLRNLAPAAIRTSGAP
jgi:hypothetical protein